MVTKKVQTSHLTFQQGILESQESSKLDIGFLTQCVNWVPEPNGALRVRAGWEQGSINGLTTTRQCRGIGMFIRQTDPAIVQSTNVVHQFGSGTPILTWQQPTRAGNTLVAFISLVPTGSGAITFTPATGWVARAAIPGTVTIDVPVTGIYELVTSQSYSGDTTPFAIPTGTSMDWYLQILELAGVAAFDQFDDTPSTAGASVTMTTAATTQASELVLGFDTVLQTTATLTSLATATPGFSEYSEANIQVSVGSRWHTAAVYSKAVRATGVQTLTVDATPATNDLHAGAVITYKGWNTLSAPGDVSNRWLAANADSGNTYDIVSIDRTLNTFALNGAWLTVDTNLGSAAAGDPVAFTNGLSNAWYTSASFPGIRRYDGASGSYVTGSPVGARCVAIHLNRVWAAAGTRLSGSKIGDGTVWTAPDAVFFDIGRDDGENIEDITPFGGGLLIGKKTSLHYLTGTTTADFQVTQLDGGGAAPGRSILATPYGCIVAGLEQVWVFDGAQVRPIGRAIQHSYGLAETDFVSTSYIDGCVYIAVHSSAKVFVFDLNAGTWRIEQIGDDTAEAAAILYNYGPTQLYGPWAGVIGSIVNFRTFPDPMRAKDFEPLPEVFIAQTGDLALAGVRKPVSPQQLYVQLRQRDGNASDVGLTITPVFDGVDSSTSCPVPARDVEVRRKTVDGFPQRSGVNTVGLKIEQTLQAGDLACFDVEDVYLDFIEEGPWKTTE